jgi:hypothetical protein
VFGLLSTESIEGTRPRCAALLRLRGAAGAGSSCGPLWSTGREGVRGRELSADAFSCASALF